MSFSTHAQTPRRAVSLPRNHGDATTNRPRSHVTSVLPALLPPFRMGGIPARTHRDDKLLIYLGIIDILQSYR